MPIVGASKGIERMSKDAVTHKEPVANAGGGLCCEKGEG